MTTSGDAHPSRGDLEMSETEARDVRHAWARLVPESDRIAEGIAAHLLRTTFEQWDDRSPGYLADLSGTIRHQVRMGLRRMAGLSSATEHAGLQVWRSMARRRAAQGVPLELVITSGILGARFTWEELLRSQPDPRTAHEERVLLLAGHALWANLDIQSSVIVKEYRLESERLQRLVDARRGEVLDGIVDGRAADPQFADHAREVLGISAGSQVTCVVGRVDGLSGTPLPQVEEDLQRAGITSFWHGRGDQVVGIVLPGRTGEAELVRRLSHVSAGRVAVMACQEGLAGFAAAYRLATRAVGTLEAGCRDTVQVVSRVPHMLLTGDEEVAHVLVAQVLGRVLAQGDHQRTVLLDTLEAYLATGLSPTGAAERLVCHRNTVVYRMRQLAELTPYDPHRQGDRLLLELALVAVRTRGVRPRG